MTRQRKAKIYELPKPKPIKSVIGQIEDLLKMAKSGELRAFVIVAELRERKVLTTYNMTESDDFLMLGYAERLKHRIHKSIDAAMDTTPYEDETS